MIVDALGTKDIVTIKTSVDRIVIAMTAKNALRSAARGTVCTRRSAGRNVSRLFVAAIAENIDWVR